MSHSLFIRNAGPVRVFFSSSKSLEQQWKKQRLEKNIAKPSCSTSFVRPSVGRCWTRTVFEKTFTFTVNVKYTARSTKIVNKNFKRVRRANSPGCRRSLRTWRLGRVSHGRKKKKKNVIYADETRSAHDTRRTYDRFAPF